MLLYHPAFDNYHASFRALALAWSVGNPLEIERLRILDFYLVFPAELSNMKFPQNLRPQKSKWKNLASKYNRLPDFRSVFTNMEPFQQEGINALISTGLVHYSETQKTIAINTTAIPAELAQRTNSSITEKHDLFLLLANLFSDISLYGPSGLKARSGLFDYRYDLV